MSCNPNKRTNVFRSTNRRSVKENQLAFSGGIVPCAKCRLPFIQSKNTDRYCVGCADDRKKGRTR